MLDSLQKQAIQVAMKNIHDPVYLFGSRANPLKKVGDVDIMIIYNALYADHIYKTSLTNIPYYRPKEKNYPRLSSLNKNTKKLTLFDKKQNLCPRKSKNCLMLRELDLLESMYVL